MNTRAIAIGLALVFAAAFLVPAVSDDSEAVETTRTSIFYVYEIEYTQTSTMSTSGMTFTFVEGSENHNKFLAYVNDPQNNPFDGVDDNPKAGDDCRAYVFEYVESDIVYFNGDYVTGKLVMSPYGDSMFSVVSGNTLTVTLTSAVNNYGNSRDCGLYRYGAPYSQLADLSLNKEVSVKVSSTATYMIWCDQTYGAVYLDLTYTASGQTEPNGSATLFAAVCFVFTAIAVGLVAVASVKPRWAK
ncbi:MAG: hypothetical protein Q4Q58_06665 [Thermoplasmata archaeon]|nr:hypothetical protein [Thermoplasmata archaeon]